MNTYNEEPEPDIRVGDVVMRRGGRIHYVVAKVERRPAGHCSADLLDTRTGRAPQDRHASLDRLILVHRDADAPAQAPPIPWSEDALQRFMDDALSDASRDWYADNATAGDLERAGWRVAWLDGLGEMLAVPHDKIMIADPNLDDLESVARCVLSSLDAHGRFRSRR